MKQYRTDDFTLSVPKEWQKQALVTFSSDLESHTQHNVTVTNQHVPDAAENAIGYATQQHDDLAKRLQGYKQLNRFKHTSGELSVPGIVYEWNTGNQIVVQCQLFFAQGDTVWTLTTTCPQADYESFQHQIREIASGFVLHVQD